MVISRRSSYAFGGRLKPSVRKPWYSWGRGWCRGWGQTSEWEGGEPRRSRWNRSCSISIVEIFWIGPDPSLLNEQCSSALLWSWVNMNKLDWIGPPSPLPFLVKKNSFNTKICNQNFLPAPHLEKSHTNATVELFPYLQLSETPHPYREHISTPPLPVKSDIGGWFAQGRRLIGGQTTFPYKDCVEEPLKVNW